MSTALPAMLEQPLLGALVEHGLLAAGDRHHDRAPEVVALGRLGERRLLLAREQLSRSRSARGRSTGARPRPRSSRAAAPTALGRRPGSAGAGARWTRGRRHLAEKVMWSRSRSWSSAAASAMAASVAVGGDAVDEQRLGRDADGERGAARRLADRVATAARPTRPTAGCSGGYSVQLRAATSSARATRSRPRTSSGESWETWDTAIIAKATLQLRCQPRMHRRPACRRTLRAVPGRGSPERRRDILPAACGPSTSS